jgi:hypothetical protein
MKDLLNAGQVLGRSEMKKIMAGSGSTNCVICPWDHYCICWECWEGNNPPPPSGCSYGDCGSEC